jgi:hypothetical protein
MLYGANGIIQQLLDQRLMMLAHPNMGKGFLGCQDFVIKIVEKQW